VTFTIVNPRSLGEPKGWNNGLLAPAGARLLFVAGQAGWEAESPGDPPGFEAQFTRALDKVLAVIAEAGGRPEDLARLTIYVTDLAAYRAARKSVGESWRARLGRFYPAVALVEVSGLMDPGAMVEMEATAMIPVPAKE
jgi:enamine deaminase RidA (YjgF/YER057c/UK114 family)